MGGGGALPVPGGGDVVAPDGSIQTPAPGAPTPLPPSTPDAVAPGAAAPTGMSPALPEISDRLRIVLEQVRAIATQLGAASAVPPAGTTPANPGFIVPGHSAAGGTNLDAIPGRTPGIRLTTPGDQALVDGMLAQLARTPTGAQVVASLTKVGTTVTVLDDAQFAAMGHAESSAWFNNETDTMYVRRSTLQTDGLRAAAVFGHEATHAIDDAAGLGASLADRNAVSIAKEARAFTIHAQLQRELGIPPEGILADVVRTGANDQATYRKIFTMLVQAGPAGGYNTTGANVAPFEL